MNSKMSLTFLLKSWRSCYLGGYFPGPDLDQHCPNTLQVLAFELLPHILNSVGEGIITSVL